MSLLYRYFLSGLIWFFVFGTIGAIAGLLVPSQGMNTDVFKTGGYLVVLFVPIGLVSLTLALTISTGDVGLSEVTGTTVGEVEPRLVEAQVRIRQTPQMQTAGILDVVGWFVAIVVLRPFLEEFYDIDRVRSVVAVLPSTLVAVLAALLL